MHASVICIAHISREPWRDPPEAIDLEQCLGPSLSCRQLFKDGQQLERWITNHSFDDGLTLFAWPTQDMFELGERLEEEQFLMQARVNVRVHASVQAGVHACCQMCCRACCRACMHTSGRT